jgi:hypothetical protein
MNELKLTEPQFKEIDIKKQLTDYLRLKGVFNFHLLQGFGSYVGLPDRMIFYKGNLICVEVKAGKNKQSEGQIDFEKHCKENGIRYVVCRQVEDVIKVLKEVDNG